MFLDIKIKIFQVSLILNQIKSYYCRRLKNLQTNKNYVIDNWMSCEKVVEGSKSREKNIKYEIKILTLKF